MNLESSEKFRRTARAIASDRTYLKIDADSHFTQAFSMNHTHTLREMRLRNIYLSEPEGWTDAADELGKILRLNFIALASMADGSIDGEPYITREKTESTICRFMQWVPKGQLRLAADGDNMSLAWHVNNFLPSPTLADFINAKQNICVEAR